MHERRWTTIDKIEWGTGPWLSEPDKVQWIDDTTGLDCLIVRNPRHGALCGYVGVPSDHPLFGLDYDDPRVQVNVHGGLTFADKCAESDDPSQGVCHVPEAGRPELVWWFGFDCVHSHDLAPGTAAKDPSHIPWWVEDYRNIDYVAGEVEFLASQLASPSERKTHDG